MKAVVIPEKDRVEVREMPNPVVGEREVLVSIRAAALNHRDVWIKLGQYAGLKFPCIPGSDGAGVVREVGSGVDRGWIGREVIINPSFNWGEQARAQGDQFTILGLPRDGTLAEQIVVPAEQLSPKPAHLSWQEAAALPLAGLTAYRALFTRAMLKQEDRLLVSGIGGGVALAALQFARAVGVQVWVTSSSADKIQRAMALGASGGFNYTEPDWASRAAEVPGLFDVIVDSAGGEGFERLVDAAAPGGRIVFYGATRGNPPVLPMRKVFWRQLTLLGTTMGSPHDWVSLVKFVTLHGIRPVVSDVVPLERATEAFELMQRGGQFGKIVVEVPQS
ncbi:alcohol dehydrogenase [Opitutaceae bacterium EW11]|nr:alcohol dehydrogenase [Opitutaceae bacterium EW11]